MSRPRSSFIIFLALFACFAANTFAQDLLPDLVRRVKPSAVAIETFDSRGNSLSRGSGFFTANDRIITNRHVIERSSRVEVHLLDGKKFPVKGVIAVDGEGDLALLQVDIPAQYVRPLPIVRNVPQEGESIVVIGNPFGLEGSVSNGIVSAVREISGYGKIIQITAPISPGSSGSPVVNMMGQVIGIATLQAAEGQSLNFAVPAERIFQLRTGDVQTFTSLNTESQKNKRAAAERLYSQGVAQLSLDDYARALPFFEKAVEIDNTYPEAWYQAGFCYGVLGRHEKTGLPLPMGGNAIKRDLGPELMKQVSKCLHQSILYSMENREDALAYAMQFARDMSPEVADRFVAMWVNDLTLDYGKRGKEGVKRLLAEGHNAGLIPHKVKVDFVE